MLYLPPGVAHEGTAIGECITYSIGFRAPTHQELLEPFLSDFAAHAEARRAVRGSRSACDAASRGAARRDGCARCMPYSRATPSAPSDCARFLLAHLSEPKAQVVFDRPGRPLRSQPFAEQARVKHGVALDRRTRFLYSSGSIGINGECSTLEHPSAVRCSNCRIGARCRRPSCPTAVLRHLAPLVPRRLAAPCRSRGATP